MRGKGSTSPLFCIFKIPRVLKNNKKTVLFIKKTGFSKRPVFSKVQKLYGFSRAQCCKYLLVRQKPGTSFVFAKSIIKLGDIGTYETRVHNYS